MLTIEIIIIILILSVSVVADGWRDASFAAYQRGEVRWLKWHIVKWLSVYPAWIYLFLRALWIDLRPEFLLLIPLAWTLWWLGAVLGGVTWKPFWWKYIKKWNR